METYSARTKGLVINVEQINEDISTLTLDSSNPDEGNEKILIYSHIDRDFT